MISYCPHTYVAYSLTYSPILTYSPTFSLALLYTQFFGHGDPVFPTSARHQVHIQFEKDDGILGIIKDSGDVDRYTRDCMKKWCPSDEYSQENPSCFMWFFNTTERNPVPHNGSESACGGPGWRGREKAQGTTRMACPQRLRAQHTPTAHLPSVHVCPCSAVVL